MINTDIKRQKLDFDNPHATGAFSGLPNDVISCCIFSRFRLNDQDLKSLAQVCKAFYHCSKDFAILRTQLNPITTLAVYNILIWKFRIKGWYNEEMSASKIIQYCPNFKTLRITGIDYKRFDSIIDEDFFCDKIIIDVPKMQSLNISFATSKRLTILNCQKLIRFTGKNSTVEELTIKKCNLISLKPLQIENFANLELLSLESLENFKTIECQSTSVKTLRVKSCQWIQTIALKNMTSLETVDFKSCSCWTPMTLPNSLETLSITRCGLSKLDISGLNLTSLFFKNSLLCMPEILENLPSSLKLLGISCCEFAKFNFPNLKNLELLMMEKCPIIEDFIIDNLENIKKIQIQNCEKLKNLKIGKAPLLEKIVISNCPTLEMGWSKSLPENVVLDIG